MPSNLLKSETKWSHIKSQNSRRVIARGFANRTDARVNAGRSTRSHLNRFRKH